VRLTSLWEDGPWRERTLASSPKEILRLVDDALASPSGRAAVLGTTSASSFEIARRNTWTNGFEPRLEGTLLERPSGSLLRYRLAVRQRAATALQAGAGVTAFLLIGLAAFYAYLFMDEPIEALKSVPYVLFPVFGVSVPWIQAFRGWHDAPSLERWLDEVIRQVD
jgi:hypothetical protein